MIYIHELESVLSSTFLPRGSFSLSLPRLPNIMGSQATRAMARNSQLARAFTLIELLVVIAVIAVLVSLAYPVYTGILERGKATKDMNNLRQIGIATQAFLNDSDGVLFSPIAGTWTSQLEQNQKYLAGWRVLQSPFDKRAPSEAGDATTPISYGVNANIYPSGAALPTTKITNPSGFILFAPAQASGATVSFVGTAISPGQGVTVLGIGGNAVTSTPGGNVSNGTHNSRQRINALFGDLHCENMTWTAFATTTSSTPGAPGQWIPYLPYPGP
jgi:prepilin-type N-terminal cleavage/methylation domain-containing protein